LGVSLISEQSRLVNEFKAPRLGGALLFLPRRTIEINFTRPAMKKLKFVVERHPDGYVAYPLGLKGAVVGQGDSYESALADAKSAAVFHIESFGKEAFDEQDDVMEAFVPEASLTTG
jgi:predicted RNase H-like HicB family nuclease